MGNFPWFATFNFLQRKVPKAKEGDTRGKLLRNAFIGAPPAQPRLRRTLFGAFSTCCTPCALPAHGYSRPQPSVGAALAVTLLLCGVLIRPPGRIMALCRHLRLCCVGLRV